MWPRQHLVELLQKGDITISADDYGGWEKVGDLPESFPSANSQMTTQPGDFVLYAGDQFVLFYGSNSWSYTRFGHIDNVTASELKSILGSGSVTLTLSLASATAINSTASEAKTVKTSIYSADGTQLACSTTDALPKGMYIVRETKEDGTVSSKKIKL